MNENLVELIAIIDRSGSMGTIATETIGGYNGIIEEQQKEDGPFVNGVDCFVCYYAGA